MAVTLKIAAMMIDEHPYGCPDCGTPGFTLDGRGMFDAFPAWGNCPSGHSWEDPLITVGVLKAIAAARTGRQRAEDDDTFEVEIGGAVLAGLLHPELILDDVKRAARDVYWRRIVRPELLKRKRRVKAALKRPFTNAVAATKATALEAAWTAQAGGYESDPDYRPEPVNPCAACSGKGAHLIESRLHATTTVRCAVCTGTGEID
ncbi:MAG TPA: hypothetical protein VFX60_10475 [Micromonospora sp.]|nr:hypothetical protein [Micromonospora sp.]